MGTSNSKENNKKHRKSITIAEGKKPPRLRTLSGQLDPIPIVLDTPPPSHRSQPSTRSGSSSSSTSSTISPLAGLQHKLQGCRQLLQPPGLFSHNNSNNSNNKGNNNTKYSEDTPSDMEEYRLRSSINNSNSINNTNNTDVNRMTNYSNNSNTNLRNNSRKGSIATSMISSGAQSRSTNHSAAPSSSQLLLHDDLLLSHPSIASSKARKYSLSTATNSTLSGYTQSNSNPTTNRNSIISSASAHSIANNNVNNINNDNNISDDKNEGFPLAKSFWDLRSLNHIRETVKDKQRRTHYFLKRVWNGNYLVPLKNPSLVIQWSSSPGAWCFEMAMQFPHTQVIGLDELTPERMQATIPNLELRESPLYEPGGGMEQFDDDSTDLIVIRDEFMYIAPADQWDILLAEFYRVLKPGGYLEIYGQDFNLFSTGKNGEQLNQWMRDLVHSASVAHNFPKSLQYNCERLGFINIDFRQAELPVGEWSSHLLLKEMGYLAKIVIKKRLNILKHWILGLEQDVSDQEFMDVVKTAMDECESSNTRCLCYYVGCQKPPLPHASQ